MGVGPVLRTRALLVDCSPGLAELSLGLHLAAVAGVEEGPGLLHLTMADVGPAVSEAGLLKPHVACLLIGALCLTEMTVVILNGLVVGVVQGNPKLVDVRLFLETLDLGALLNTQERPGGTPLYVRSSKLKGISCFKCGKELKNPTSFSAFLLSISYLTCLGTSWAFRTLFSSAVPEEHRKKCLHVMIKSLFHIYLKSPPLTNNLVGVVSTIFGDHGGGVGPVCS